MKILSISVALAVGTVCALAQPPLEKKTEISFSGGFISRSDSRSGSSTSLTVLSPRIGFFLIEGLEIEPEASVAFSTGTDPAYLLNGNLAYNFPLQQHALAFVLAGYGVGNAVPTFNIPVQLYSHTTLGVLNLGAGLKVLASDNVAVRVELRYQHFTGSYDYSSSFIYFIPGGVSQEISLKQTSVLAGFSFFF